eukprot:6810062-Heterocapsa_arctica.AAC.1
MARANKDRHIFKIYRRHFGSNSEQTEKAGPPTHSNLADAFTHENAAYVMDTLGSLEQFAGESKKDKNNNIIEHYKMRTTDMAVIVTQFKMGR